MGSLLGFMDAELQALAELAKKKYAAVKDASDKGIVKVRMIQSKGQLDSAGQAAAIRDAQDIWLPFIMAIDQCELKGANVKVAAVSLGCLQKLLSFSAVPPNAIQAIVDGTVKQGESTDEPVLLKVLQLVLTLLTTQNKQYALTQAIHGQLLSVCFSLHASKMPSVAGTASATLRQATSILFDVLSKPEEMASSSLSVGRELPVAAKSALLLLKDLCLYAEGETGQWIRVPGVSRLLAIDILVAVLSGHAASIISQRDFVSTLRERICLLFTRHLRGTTDFAFAVRLHRLARAVVIDCAQVMIPESEIIMALLFKSVDPSYGGSGGAAAAAENAAGPQWQRVLALEVLRSVAESSKAIKALVDGSADQSSASSGRSSAASASNAASSLCDVSARYVQRLLAANPSYNFKYFPRRNDRLGAISEVDPFIQTGVSEVETLCLAVDCLMNTIGSMVSLSNTPLSLDPAKSKQEEASPSATDRTAARLAESCWGASLIALSTLFERASEEDTLQALLKAFQNYILVSGVTNLATPRDAFITALCRYSLPLGFAADALRASNSGSSSGLASSTPSSGPSAANAAGGGGAGDDAHASQLTHKNIQALKTLFNVVACLSSVLGSSWYLLLKCLQQLDSILSPAVAAAGVSPSSSSSTPSKPSSSAASAAQAAASPPASSAELATLSSSLLSLFTSSKFLSNTSLTHLMSALVQLSVDTLGSAETRLVAPAMPRLFGASKLVETVSINLFRIDAVWDVLSNHMLSIAEHDNPSVRQFAVENVTQLVNQALAPSASSPDQQSAAGSQPEQSKDQVQARLLHTLHAMYKSSHSNVREHSLNSMSQVIQRVGQYLTPAAWPLVLPVLKDAAQQALSGDNAGQLSEAAQAQVITSAFKSVQFIASDFLSALSTECLFDYIHTVGYYCKQGADVNVALTAIGLLWNISDFFKKSELEHELWMPLFCQLRDTTYDARPEVRNSAMRTLFSALMIHGDRLQDDIWIGCVQDIIFPALHGVEENASKAESQQAAQPPSNTPLGREKDGKPVMMMVHHSRNTASKQWAETRCLAIEGACRIFRTWYARLADLPEVETFKKVLASHIRSASLAAISEVAMTGLRSAHDLIHATSPPDATFWNEAWSTWTTMADNLERGEVKIEPKVVTLLLDHLSDTNSTYRDDIDDDMLKHLFTILGKILRCPVANEGVRIPTAIQESCITLMEALPPMSDELWIHMFKELSQCMPSDAAVTAAQHSFYNGPSPSSTSLPPIKFARRVLSMLEDIYSQKAPSDVQLILMVDFVKSLGPALKTRYLTASSASAVPASPSSPSPLSRGSSFAGSAPSEPYDLWRSAINALLSILRTSLPLVSDPEVLASSKYAGDSRIDMDRVWGTVQQTLQSFLSPYEESGNHGECEDEDSRVLELFRDHVLVYCHTCPQSILSDLVLLLVAASKPINSRTCHEATRSVFAVVERASSQPQQKHSAENIVSAIERVGKLALPALLGHCNTVLKQYVEEDRRTGLMPLPKYRRDETHFVLDQLRRLEVVPSLYESLAAHPPAGIPCPSSPAACAPAFGTKGHLVRLFPTLSEFISCRDESLRETLQDIFRIVSVEMVLKPSGMSH